MECVVARYKIKIKTVYCHVASTWNLDDKKGITSDTVQ